MFFLRPDQFLDHLTVIIAKHAQNCHKLSTTTIRHELVHSKKVLLPLREKKHVSVLNNIAVHHANSRQRCKVSYKRSLQYNENAVWCPEYPAKTLIQDTLIPHHWNALWLTFLLDSGPIFVIGREIIFVHCLGLSVSLSFVESWLAIAAKATKVVHWIQALILSTANNSCKSCQ